MKLKYIFFLLIFFINFSGCQQEPETQLTLKNKLTLFNFIEYNKKISKPYLFLLYFAGDNNGMNTYLNSNLDSITKGLNNFNNSIQRLLHFLIAIKTELIFMKSILLQMFFPVLQ